METVPKANSLPFLTARARLASRYHINMDKDDFIERGYYVWREIGNIATRRDSFSTVVPPDGIVNLPKGTEFVESVTNVSSLPNTVTNTSEGKYSMDSSGARQDVRPDKAATSAEDSARTSRSYSYGVSVNYDTGDGFIKITSPAVLNQAVTISYSYIDKDEDGLPLLAEKEVHAIACNLALQEAEQKLFQGQKGSDLLVQYLKTESDRLMQAAKTPERFNDDELDRMLDIKTSWDRKVYGKRYNLF